MSLDMTADARSAASPAVAEVETDEAVPSSRLRVYELMVAAVAVFGAVMTSAIAVLLYLR